jgi:hypothetical protein
MITSILTLFLTTHAYGESGQKQSTLNLVRQKHTACHDISRVQGLHKTEKDPKSVVAEMQKKEGSDITDEQVEELYNTIRW